jgi:hypothetical protein
MKPTPPSAGEQVDCRPWLLFAAFSGGANSTGAVCGQKTSKFFVSHREESIAGHVGIKGIY